MINCDPSGSNYHSCSNPNLNPMTKLKKTKVVNCYNQNNSLTKFLAIIILKEIC